MIRNTAGKVIGHGQYEETVHGSEISSDLSLRFLDGSVDEETSRFTQAGTLRLVSDHHVQRGPFFKERMEMSVKANGDISLGTSEGSKAKNQSKTVELPPDTVNGLVGAAFLNLPPTASERTYSFIAPYGDGRLIKLKVTRERKDKFAIGGMTVAADVLRVHYDLGGIEGVVAPLIGKQPPDAFVWITTGVPTLVREQLALYEGGPMLSLEIAGARFSASR